MAASTMSMKLGSATATTRSSNPAQRFQKVAPRTSRGRFTVSAVSKDQSADKNPMPKIAAGVLGALTAAQLAVMPFAAPAQAGFLGEVKDQIQNPAARAEANRETSNLPTLKEVGQSIGSFGTDTSKLPGPNDAKGVASQVGNAAPSLPSAGEVANKVDANTPGGVGGFFQNLTDKLTGSDPVDAAKGAASDVKSQVGANTPATPNPQELKGDADRLAKKVGGDLPGPGDTGNIFESMKDKFTGAGTDVKGAAQDLKDQVSFNLPGLPSAEQLKAKIDANTPNLPSAGNLKGQADSAAWDVKGKGNSVAGDVKSQVGKAGSDIKGAARDLKNQVSFNLPGLPSAEEVKGKIDANTPDLPSLNTPNLPSAESLKGKADNAAGDVKSQIGRATPDLPSAGYLGDKLSNAIPDVKLQGPIPNVNKLTDKVQGAFPDLPNTNDLASKPI